MPAPTATASTAARRQSRDCRGSSRVGDAEGIVDSDFASGQVVRAISGQARVGNEVREANVAVRRAVTKRGEKAGSSDIEVKTPDAMMLHQQQGPCPDPWPG